VDSALRRVDRRAQSDGGDDAMVALASVLLSVRMGDTALAERVLARLSRIDEVLGQPPVAETMAVVRARLAIQRGKPDEAVALLAPWLTAQASFQTRVAAMDAQLAQGANGQALAQADYLASNRGRAYTEVDCAYCLQPLNVLDSNRAADVAATLRRRPEPTAAAITVP
jgi:predicted Zn-dependent protease